MLLTCELFDGGVYYLIFFDPRFEKRIYIPLPEANARAKMVGLNIGSTPCKMGLRDYKLLAKKTDGYIDIA